MGAFISNKQSMGEGDMTQAKPTADVYLLCTGTHLTNNSTKEDKAPQNTFIQNPEKKRAREPLFQLGAWMTEGSQEAHRLPGRPL